MLYSEAFKLHQGKVSDKWESYLGFYDEVTRDFSPMRILEIGVQNGGSLEVWSEVYPDAELIMGVDIEPKCGELVFSKPSIKVLVGDATTGECLAKVQSVTPRFDLIVDDGSHHSEDIISALVNYLPMLSPGGKFVIEDLHASYWPSWGGGLLEGEAVHFFLKRLVDVINFEHWDQRVSVENYLTGFAPLSESFLSAVSKIEKISFQNSMCEITLVRGDSLPQLGVRVSAGVYDLVNKTIASAAGSLSRPEISPALGNLGFDQLSPNAPELQARVTRELMNKLEILNAKRDGLVAERDGLVAERDGLVAERDGLVAERDGLVAERDGLVAERDALISSISWRLTAPVRRLGRHLIK